MWLGNGELTSNHSVLDERELNYTTNTTSVWDTYRNRMSQNLTNKLHLDQLNSLTNTHVTYGYTFNFPYPMYSSTGNWVMKTASVDLMKPFDSGRSISGWYTYYKTFLDELRICIRAIILGIFIYSIIQRVMKDLETKG